MVGTDKSGGARSIETDTCYENRYSKMMKQGQARQNVKQEWGKRLVRELGCGGGAHRSYSPGYLKERRGQDLVRSDEQSRHRGPDLL